jgi:acyl-CoA dehydrogenase
LIPRVPLLPTPFLEVRHEELAAFARAELSAPLAEIDARFADGRLDEEQAARAAVKALSGTRVLHEAVLGEARSLCVARREVAWISGFADCLLALQGLGSAPLRIAGTTEQKRRWLEPAAFGAAIPAFALTEPEAGSDARHLRTVARRDGDHYVLDGSKTLITNAGIADYYCLFARLAADGRHVAFVIESATPGLVVARRLAAMAPHPIGEVVLQGCRVPVAQRLGEEGEGLDLALATLDRFRASVGAAALGLALRALGEGRAHLRARRQFGKALADFQLLKAQLAGGYVALERAHLAVLRAAWLTDRAAAMPAGSAAGIADAKAAAAASSLAKLDATEAAQAIIDRAVQFHGGRGVMKGSVVERLYREVRALRIYEGTSEIQQLILARELLQGSLAGEG